MVISKPELFNYAGVNYIVDTSFSDWYSVYMDYPVLLPNGVYLKPSVWNLLVTPPIPYIFEVCRAPELYSKILIAEIINSE